MEEDLKTKARNYYMLGSIAEMMGMLSEAATNFFKALFAVDDAKIKEKIKTEPKDTGGIQICRNPATNK